MEDKTPLEKMKNLNITQMLDKMKKTEPFIEDIIKKVNPDVIVVDMIMICPVILKSNKPWINLMPANPLGILLTKNLPPSNFGLPTNDNSEWEICRKEVEKFSNKYFQYIKEWFNAYNIEPPYSKESWFGCSSPYLNLYAFPEELDYTDVRPMPEKWLRFDSFIRNDGQQPFEIPEKLKNKPGKLIYFSLGSVGTSQVKLMKKLTGFLSELPHRFIVSKEIFGDQYELPDNCWGENHVPQTKILEIVDLAIIHGGNNSLCETFYFGKPMIVMPLFGDQYDNAQRVHEKGYGIRIDPYKCTKEELLSSIEKLLNDKETNNKLKEVANRIDNDIKLSNLVEKIEEVVNNNSTCK